jgi:hypothetical protein
METASSEARKPTPRQLQYLRTLAERTGTTFAKPRTVTEASGEITRLKELLLSRGPHRELPRQAEAEGEAPYGTAPRPGEVRGWGSRAGWREPPGGELRSSAWTSDTGAPRDLAAYEAGGEGRVVYARRVAGVEVVADRPASGGGRIYVIDRGLDEDGADALEALVADYLRQAQQLGAVPMRKSAWRELGRQNGSIA